jgi:hypothetical protein
MDAVVSMSRQLLKRIDFFWTVFFFIEFLCPPPPLFPGFGFLKSTVFYGIVSVPAADFGVNVFISRRVFVLG